MQLPPQWSSRLPASLLQALVDRALSTHSSAHSTLLYKHLCMAFEAFCNLDPPDFIPARQSLHHVELLPIWYISHLRSIFFMLGPLPSVPSTNLV